MKFGILLYMIVVMRKILIEKCVTYFAVYRPTRIVIFAQHLIMPTATIAIVVSLCFELEIKN